MFTREVGRHINSQTGIATSVSSNYSINGGDVYDAAPARRALIGDGSFTLSDLGKTSLAAIKELHGTGPNAIRVLVEEMKKANLSFRK